MSRAADIARSFSECNGPFDWRRFVTLIRSLGYEEIRKKGKTSGSRMKFINQATKHMIMVHKPHNGEMGPEMVKRIKLELQEQGLL